MSFKSSDYKSENFFQPIIKAFEASIRISFPMSFMALFFSDYLFVICFADHLWFGLSLADKQ